MTIFIINLIRVNCDYEILYQYSESAWKNPVDAFKRVYFLKKEYNKSLVPNAISLPQEVSYIFEVEELKLN